MVIPLAAPILLCRVEVPDRHVGVVQRFGHELDNPTLWGGVTWDFKLNSRPIENYQTFRQQIGTFVNPTLLPNPIKLKPFDVFEVFAFSTVDVGAMVRVMGFIFPVRFFSQDGTFRSWHTL